MTASTAKVGPLERRFYGLLRLDARIFRIVRVTAWPFIDLGLRVWLGQSFFVSGVLKVTHWDTALRLATYEYPVSWMSPVTGYS